MHSRAWHYWPVLWFWGGFCPSVCRHWTGSTRLWCRRFSATLILMVVPLRNYTHVDRKSLTTRWCCTLSSLSFDEAFGKNGSLLHHSLVVKCILVGSPGFVKDQFTSYLFKEAVRQDNKVLLENRPKFMMVHSSSGHKYSLKGARRCGPGGGDWDGDEISPGSQLIEGLIVLQKSSLIPQWRVDFLTLRWFCILCLLVCLFLSFQIAELLYFPSKVKWRILNF